MYRAATQIDNKILIAPRLLNSADPQVVHQIVIDRWRSAAVDLDLLNRVQSSHLSQDTCYNKVAVVLYSAPFSRVIKSVNNVPLLALGRTKQPSSIIIFFQHSIDDIYPVPASSAHNQWNMTIVWPSLNSVTKLWRYTYYTAEEEEGQSFLCSQVIIRSTI